MAFGLTEQDYINAFTDVLEPEDIRRGATEAEHYATLMAGPGGVNKLINPGVIRNTLGRSGDGTKEKVINTLVADSDKRGHDFSDVAKKLNGGFFKLSKDRRCLEAAYSDEITKLFPPGQEDEWPTLVMTASSNLVSGQSFFDNFIAASKVVPRILPEINADNMVIVGSYDSSKHFNANALDTIQRSKELGINPNSLEHYARIGGWQGIRLLSLLLERDDDGTPKVHHDKPVLRQDAGKILKHIVGYGYSAAHMANSDAFRFLRKVLADGDIGIRVLTPGTNYIRNSKAADAADLLGDAKLIGMAGVDRQDVIPVHRPKTVNFISDGDSANAANGPGHNSHEDVIPLVTPGVSALRAAFVPLLGEPALEPVYGGHEQEAYVNALLDKANIRAVGKATLKLRGLKITPQRHGRG